MTSRNDKGALILVGTAATIGILVLLTLLLQPAPQPVAPEVNIPRVTSPPPQHAHAGKIVKPKVQPQPYHANTVIEGVGVAMGSLMAIGICGLFLWLPYAMRRSRARTQARWQAEGWLEAQDRHQAKHRSRRIQEPL